MKMVELEVEDDCDGIRNRRHQYFAVFSACLGAFAIGNVVSWSSAALPEIEKDKPFGELSPEDQSWIASVVTLAALVAGPLSGLLMDKAGRKKSLLILAVPFTIGWLLILFAQNILMIKVGRFITGLCMGSLSLIIPVFIAELSEESIRGALSTLFPMFAGAGILFTSVLAMFMNWFAMTLVFSLVPVFTFICLLFVPESHVYLIMKERLTKADKALQWFRGTTSSDHIQKELHQIRRALDEKRETRLSVKEIFTPQVLKPTGIVLGLMFFQQLSGINVVVFYTTKIFEEAGAGLDSKLSSTIVGIVLLIAICASTILIDKLGRRVLLLMSALGMTVSLVAMGTFFYLKDQNNDVVPEGTSWLPLFSLMLFVVAFNIGYGPVPWMMTGELLPTYIKGFGGAIAVSFNWFLAFLVIKCFEDFVILMGNSGCYWSLATVCLMGSAFGYFFVPETKGKTLEEIQQIFKSK